ncbi:MAG TPA: class I SAM-dependent methyltransferase [Ktedonobacterales bacterium]|nr:class I SAM-dependent methyltransferase [Ktedonobacterales bacterium]
MPHCQCEGIERCFNPRRVTNELERYRKRGLAKSTRLLVEALQAQGIDGLTLLDIGGGVGAIIHALLRAGARQATDVDASAAYLAVARDEAARQGLGERISFQHGDFVALAPTLPAADVVTLDRVICCYDDMPALVRLSAARAEHLYGVVYPRDTWWLRLFIRVQNVVMQAMRAPMRFFVHPTAAVDAMIRAQGLERRFYRTAGPWQVVVYGRTQAR